MHYATRYHAGSKYAQPGQPAQELEVRMELKVIADVGPSGSRTLENRHFFSRE